MRTTIPDFTEAEQRLIGQMLQERHGLEVPVQLADAEIMLDPMTKVLESCPVAVWESGASTLLVLKLAGNRFRCQFDDGDGEQYGTARNEFNELADCVTTLLRAHSDHQLSRHGVASSLRTIDPASAHGGQEYDGPLVI